MTIKVGLESATLAADAGGSVSCDVRLANDGPEPVTVELAVSGPGRPYSWIAPDRVTVQPGATATSRVGFHLPRAATPAAGPLAFEVCAGRSGPGEPEARAGGVIEIRPFSVLSANLSPPEDDGDGGFRRVLTLGNRGNAPAVTALRIVVEDDDLDVTVDPQSVAVTPGEPATASVSVRPRGGGRREGGGLATYRLVADPATGDPVELTGRFEFAPARVRRSVGRSTWIGVGVAVALVAGVVLVVAGGDDDSPEVGDDVAIGAPVANECPAENHTDPHGITGLRPEDIPNLPAGYSFFAVADDGCTQIRFNPCEPIHYVINPANAPPEGVADVREAFARLSRATGMTFVDDGFTEEEFRREPYVPDRYPDRWAPILVVWSEFSQRDRSQTTQIVGRGAGMREGDIYVSGLLRLNKDAVIDQEGVTPVPGGFGPEIGSGTGAIGAEGVTWGRIILHELGHVVGLGHVRDAGQIMYPETAEQTFRPSDFRPGDRDGLALLGRDAGCLETPPVPAA